MKVNNIMSQNDLSTVSIDDLLDGTLDDLEDLPEFKPFPVGTHRSTISWKFKEIESSLNGATFKQVCPELYIKGIETVELADPEGIPIKSGESVNLLFMFKKKDGTTNSVGQGQFKSVMKSLTTHYGAKSNRELMKESEGAEVLVTTKIRKDKRDASDVKEYTDLVALAVL